MTPFPAVVATIVVVNRDTTGTANLAHARTPTLDIYAPLLMINHVFNRIGRLR
jgi:hypothetical protein